MIFAQRNVLTKHSVTLSGNKHEDLY